MKRFLTFITALLTGSLVIAEPFSAPIKASDVLWKQGLKEITVDGLKRTFLLDLPDHWQRRAASFAT